VIITLEGGEGAGKTTQAALLKEYLEQKGRRVVSLREPGGSPLSESIRGLFLECKMDSMSELMLLIAARRENIKTIVEPALRDGFTVIIDRFIDSTLVYQGIVGGIGLQKTRGLMEEAGVWLEPDITFLLDIDPEKASARYVPSDRLEMRGPVVQQKIRQGFLEVCSEKRHRVIKADKSLDEISNEIRNMIIS
jgi:dTMP kinase